MKRKKNTPGTGVLLRLLGVVAPHAGYLILALLSSVVGVAAALYGPVLVGQAVDLITGPGGVDYQGVRRILVMLGVTVVIGAVFQWLFTLCTNTVSYRTVKDLRTRAFRKLEKVPLRYIDGHPHGDVISRVIGDVDVVSDGLLQGFSQLFTGVVTIVGTLIFMLGTNVSVALVVVLLTPLSLFAAAFIAKRSHSMFREQSEVRGELGGYIDEMVSAQKVAAAFSYEDRAGEAFEEINRRLYDCGWKAHFYSAITNPCTRFVNGLVYAGAGVFGALAAISGTLTVGGLSRFLSYANQYTKPFNEISGVVTELQSALASARRIFELLDEPAETPDAPDAMALQRSEGRVSLKDVDFSYSPEKELIRGFSLEVSPGERVAIVGPTGSGKTTIINLLMRFYDVDGGEIRVDGTDIRDVTRRSLRAQYGMVLQESWLFSGTVRDNIAYGKKDAADEEIVAAAKAAHAHSFITRLPEGYDTVLTGDGAGISLGQKQLICVARIMLTRPPMLILDEATSSIDTLTEQRIQRAFQRMMEGRTNFVVAHRLSTIRNADCILVMRDGNIVEQGRHEELLEKNGFYAELYYSQFAVS